MAPLALREPKRRRIEDLPAHQDLKAYPGLGYQDVQKLRAQVLEVPRGGCAIRQGEGQIFP